mmetsp:Transcript_16522/g.33854  ORF Transcript_16522/g.33854 Transcript_16522/m.33854 type:complete len:94 (+) Transcript_16522:70-351(+)
MMLSGTQCANGWVCPRHAWIMSFPTGKIVAAPYLKNQMYLILMEQMYSENHGSLEVSDSCFAQCGSLEEPIHSSLLVSNVNNHATNAQDMANS